MDETTFTIRLEEGGSGPGTGPAPPPRPDAAAAPPPNPEAARQADRLGLALADVSARITRGLLTLDEGLARAERLGKGDAGLDYARDRGFSDFPALAREVLGRSAAAPAPAPQPAGGFDFTPPPAPARQLAPDESAELAELRRRREREAPADAMTDAAYGTQYGRDRMTAAERSRLAELVKLEGDANEAHNAQFAPPPPPPAAAPPAPPQKPPPPPGDTFDFTPAGPERFDFTPQKGPADPLGTFKPPPPKGDTFDFSPPKPPAPAEEPEKPADGPQFNHQLAAIASAVSGGTRSAAGIANIGLQAAGAGLLGTEAAALAAGPVGAAIAAGAVVVDAAVGELAGAFTSARGGVQRLGQVAVAVAGNDGLGAVAAAGEHVAAGFDQIPVVGKLFAEQVRLATAVVATFGEVTTAVVARGRQLAAYDARLAAANAVADIRTVQGDIREAERTGESVARLTDATSRVNDQFRQATDPIKDAGAAVLADLLEILAELLTLARTTAGPAIEGATATVKLLSLINKSGLLTVLKLLNAVLSSSWLQALIGDGEPDSAARMQLAQATRDVLGLADAPHGRPQAASIANPAAAAAGQVLGLPLLTPPGR